MYDVPCSGKALVAVQCRQVGSNDTFSHQWLYNGNMLYVPCNASGLVCRNQDQVFHDTDPCADYELRVLCDTAGEWGVRVWVWVWVCFFFSVCVCVCV